MCRLVISAINDGNQSVIATIKRLFGGSALPQTPQELCNRVLHTVYMGMSQQSSRETRQRAKDLSDATGSYHINLDIDSVYHAQKDLVKSSLGLDAKFKVEGGSEAENLMLQNIQARTRMVVRRQIHTPGLLIMRLILPHCRPLTNLLKSFQRPVSWLAACWS